MSLLNTFFDEHHRFGLASQGRSVETASEVWLQGAVLQGLLLAALVIPKCDIK